MVCAGLMLGGCGSESQPTVGGPRQLISINVQPGNAQAIPPDGTIPFSATGTFNQAPTTQSNLPLQWTSSDSNIALVDAATGIATCISLGGPIGIIASAAGKGGTVLGSAQLACFSSGPAAKLDPPSLGLGCVFVASGNRGACVCTAQVSTTLTNVGVEPLDIADISLENGDQSFSQTSNCGASLSTGQSCTTTVGIPLSLLPLGTHRQDNLVITDNAPDSPQKVSLSGVRNCTH